MTAPFDPSRAPAVNPLSPASADQPLPLPRRAAATVYRRFGKRALDIFFVLAAAPAVLLCVLVLALIIARDGGSPFFSQMRIGKDGRAYRMWKLRTMVTDADARLEAHLAIDPVAHDEWHRTQKLRNDPRITRFGRALRKTSLDELPQLWNVLKGDMSLVGPRPMLPCQQPLYPGSAYYRLRPGITGMWQVSSRNNSEFVERAAFDQEYERRLSFVTDMRLILATLVVVLQGTGH
ncbi:sugar transferase [Tabrizicola sp. TH137]|uniref:sugar transferase n=1 Tax=Tabrizicola sp. TH137 TaxID=2067452 RepID=UPI000C798799|nr:sugar transferase [Tabrizicola sp. TH137]PLL10750.1 sugar transferase [Tabrizicola sp. TH137]